MKLIRNTGWSSADRRRPNNLQFSAGPLTFTGCAGKAGCFLSGALCVCPAALPVIPGRAAPPPSPDSRRDIHRPHGRLSCNSVLVSDGIGRYMCILWRSEKIRISGRDKQLSIFSGGKAGLFPENIRKIFCRLIAYSQGCFSRLAPLAQQTLRVLNTYFRNILSRTASRVFFENTAEINGMKVENFTQKI